MIFYYAINTFIFFLAGAALGSFANALSYRLKTGKGFMKERSECPHCHHMIEPRDLIPIFSYILLGGKCRHCSKKISLHYPLFELLMGIFIAAGAFMYLYQTITLAEFLIYSVFGFFIYIIAVTDFLYLFIPDGIHLFLIPIAFFKNIYFQEDFFMNFLMGLIVAAGFFVLFKTTGEERIGFGDVKLSFSAALFFGFEPFIFILMFSAILGIIYGVILSKFRINKLARLKIPLGAMIGVVSMIYILIYLQWGQEIARNYSYLKLFF
ncbi:MAG TPA: prepilin peptidase [Candidatus Dojkabacteria bacterium]|jgi:prepilin signal peptidase PulO-like enzyme (type II secretory pathway)